MILSVSNVFFSDWLLHCLKNQIIGVKNPDNQQLSIQTITPETTDSIVFWTNNALPTLYQLDELDKMGYTYFFQYTLNAYGVDIEPNLPSVDEKLATFKALSGEIGKTKVIWHYDPILFTPKYTLQWHIHAFTKLCRELSGYTNQCVIHFTNNDEKRESKQKEGQPFDLNEDKVKTFSTAFTKNLKQVADAYHIQIITKNADMDADFYRQITGKPMYATKDIKIWIPVLDESKWLEQTKKK